MPFTDCPISPHWILSAFLFAGATSILLAQETAEAPPAQRAADSLIMKQEPALISPRVLEKAKPENVSLIISLSEQRAWLVAADEVAVDSPISSGKRARMTPTGDFKVLEKKPAIVSDQYGHFIDASGNAVRVGVSTAIDCAPAGTRFESQEAKYFLQLNKEGFGIHAGYLPGYPAASGNVRLPPDVAARVFEMIGVGATVKIVP